MRSKGNNSRKILCLFGKGQIAGFGAEFAWLFAKTGFSVFPVIANKSKGWVAPELLALICKNQPRFEDGPSPGWDISNNTFDLGLALGFSFDVQNTYGLSSEFNWAIDYFERCKRVIIFSNSKIVSDIHFSYPNYLHHCEWRFLPIEIEKILKSWEETFSEIVAYFRRLKLLKGATARVRYSVPSPLLHLTSDSTGSMNVVLQRTLFNNGFTIINDLDQMVDLDIDAYPGPFLVTTKKRKTLELSFKPSQNSEKKSGKLSVRFFHHSVPLETINSLVYQDLIWATIQEHGNILVLDGTSERLFPNLVSRPAIQGLVEYLIDKLLTYNSKQ